ncbi:HET-domain-containing protein [Decorospora gaudefroyi]|uniref:HET-domain-containing protein n=1 Tax=Decorospora gaudefroyi TaxID=184978 RepID=A0A6A5K023_9PLEO|nr:HET-domain-containing protein [Decorospora gaudefroyi]
MENLRSHVESDLCDKCSVLKFDDKQLGRRQARRDVANDVLRFDFEDRRHRGKSFELDYVHTDLLPDLLRLKASADAGCAFCAALRDATLQRRPARSGPIRYRLRYKWERWSDRLDHPQLNMLVADWAVGDESFEGVGKVSHDRSLVFWVDCEEDDCNRWLGTPSPPRERPLCDQNSAWMREMLEACTTHGCAPHSSTFLPTRVLDLGTDDSHDTIKLIQLSHTHLTDSMKYTALSYCWGPREDAVHQLKTTSSSLAQHLERVDFEAMTPVIQDAVTATRALGIHYLWIDALCIIQGDADDWARESKRMGLVYVNAYATICPLLSSSCLQSFLHRPKPVRIKFQSRRRPEIHGMLNLRHQPRPRNEDVSLSTGPRQMDEKLSAWNTRAWTLQEEQLAARMIYFGSSHIYFSCPLQKAVECYPDEPYNGRKLHLPYWERPNFPNMLHQLAKSQDPDALYDQWNRLAEQHAQRQATDERDKLPALSGLAQMMAEKTQDTYLAGLWKADLLRGLLWWTSPSKLRIMGLGQLPKFPPNAYICPSWSWARHGETCPANNSVRIVPGTCYAGPFQTVRVR